MTNGEPTEPVEGEAREEGQIEAEQFEKMTGRELFTRLIDSVEQETGIELKPMHYQKTIMRWGRKLETPSFPYGLSVDICIGDQVDTSLHINAYGSYRSPNGRIEFGLLPTTIGLREIHRARKYEQSEPFESYVAKTLDAEVSVPKDFLIQFEKGIRILDQSLKQFDTSDLRDGKGQKTIEQSEGYEERVRIADQLLRRKK